MTQPYSDKRGAVRTALTVGLLLWAQAMALATDWPQYRGPTTDGSSPDHSTTWATTSPRLRGLDKWVAHQRIQFFRRQPGTGIRDDLEK